MREMRRWWCGGAVAVVMVVVVGGGAVGGTRGDEDGEGGDTAEFVVTVEGEREGAARCAGALVALRAALTSARCARAPDLWVRAAGSPTGRAASAALVRVLRVAVADIHTDSAAEVAGAEGPWVWGGVGADLALLELEETVRGTRPILAAVGGECEPRVSCYVPRVRARRLRVVPATVEPAVRCVSRGARWPSPLQERTLCLLGARLCGADWGSAVVCGGKLCGVVSRSAQSEEHDEDEDEEDREERKRDQYYKNETECGDTHAAASVPRAHRFMRCAMLHGACGRGECEQVCAERWLHGGGGGEPSTEGGGGTRAPTSTPSPSPASARRVPASHLRAHHHHKENSPESDTAGTAGESSVTEWGGTEPESEASASPAIVDAKVTLYTSGDASEDTGATGTSEETRLETEPSEETHMETGSSEETHVETGVETGTGTGTSTEACGATRTGAAGSIEFEPNRADFKMTPARTTAVCLKAGEYGDNAAEYGGEEAAAGGTCTAGALAPSPAPPTRTSPPTPAVLHAEMEARVSSAPLAADTVHTPGSSREPSPRALTLAPLLLAATCILV